MYHANYHTHSHFCRHFKGTEREIVEKAIENGITKLGFSDHSPQVFRNGYTEGMRMGLDEISSYVGLIRELREEYKNDIEIYVGFEGEYLPSIFDGLYDICKEYDIDYMIMGQHQLEYPGGLTYERVFSEEIIHTVKSFVNTVIEGMETGCFSYIGHPDVYNWHAAPRDEYVTEMTRLCVRAKELNIPLEVNNLGHTEKRHYPGDLFFGIAKEVGNSIVVGIDAHSPDQVNPEDINSTIEYAESLGLPIVKEITMLHPWRDGKTPT